MIDAPIPEKKNRFLSGFFPPLFFEPPPRLSFLSFSLSLSPSHFSICLSLLPLERCHQLQDHQKDVDYVQVDRQAREDVFVGAQRDGLATYKC